MSDLLKVSHIFNFYNFQKIRAFRVLNTIFSNPRKRRLLNIVKYNKKIQNRLNLSIKDYKEYPGIEIEIIPKKGKYGEFINIDENDELYYHIYFNDNNEEIKNTN